MVVLFTSPPSKRSQPSRSRVCESPSVAQRADGIVVLLKRDARSCWTWSWSKPVRHGWMDVVRRGSRGRLGERGIWPWMITSRFWSCLQSPAGTVLDTCNIDIFGRGLLPCTDLPYPRDNRVLPDLSQQNSDVTETAGT